MARSCLYSGSAYRRFGFDLGCSAITTAHDCDVDILTYPIQFSCHLETLSSLGLPNLTIPYSSI